MGADTRIEWATHTFNAWSGCQAVSPACDHCYAEAQAKRAPATFGGWGPHAERKRTGESYWRQPLLWNKRAAKEGTRPRVFCASMADVFDNAVPEEWRADLWALIDATPHLDWLLLTKRPQNIARMMADARRAVLGAPVADRHVTWPWPNVWLGTTVENQAEADRRIPHLLAVPAAKRFLSMEPLLGPVDLRHLQPSDPPVEIDALHGTHGVLRPHGGKNAKLDWIIAGGESGPKARPSHPDWFRSLRDQCQAAGVPFFFKQWGEWLPGEFGAPPLVEWQDGSSTDRHTLPEEGARGWDNGLDLLAEGHEHAVFRAVGKKAAGAMLDGREHREVPA